MSRKDLLVALSAAAITASATAFAADYGTSAEAKAMLEKAVVAMNKDQAAALAMFTKGEGGFKDRDLYVFCGGPDGNFTAHPTLTGKSMKDLKDKSAAAKPIGEEFYKIAQPGKIGEVSYMFPRAGQTEPVSKVTYITKVGDQVCGVGYYK